MSSIESLRKVVGYGIFATGLAFSGCQASPEGNKIVSAPTPLAEQLNPCSYFPEVKSNPTFPQIEIDIIQPDFAKDLPEGLLAVAQSTKSAQAGVLTLDLNTTFLEQSNSSQPLQKSISVGDLVITYVILLGEDSNIYYGGLISRDKNTTDVQKCASLPSSLSSSFRLYEDWSAGKFTHIILIEKNN